MTRISDEDKIQAIISFYKVKLPKNWDSYPTEKKLEFVAHRMLLDGRTSTKHSIMSAEGWLSESQLERRRRREVLSNYGSLDALPVKRGTFGRVHAKNIKPREVDE